MLACALHTVFFYLSHTALLAMESHTLIPSAILCAAFALGSGKLWNHPVLLEAPPLDVL